VASAANWLVGVVAPCQVSAKPPPPTESSPSAITELLRNGASLPEAKELARHSDVNMTMRYTHIGLADQAKAVANLPAPKPAKVAPLEGDRKAALQMRCRFCSAKGQSVATADKNGEAQKRQNPWRTKGSGKNRRQVSPPGKVEAAGIEPAAFTISIALGATSKRLWVM
jgi:hypothetical protein